MPAGTVDGKRDERTGGGSAMRVPLRGRETTTPRRRRSARAAATVVGETPRDDANARTAGRPVPSASAPEETARSMLDAISVAEDPVNMEYCSGTETNLYCNR